MGRTKGAVGKKKKEETAGTTGEGTPDADVTSAGKEPTKPEITEGADDAAYLKKVIALADRLITLEWFAQGEKEAAVTLLRDSAGDYLIDALISRADAEIAKVKAAGSVTTKGAKNVPAYSGTLEEFHLAKDTVTLKISTTTPETFAPVGLLYKQRVNITILRQTTGQQTIPFNDSADEDDDAGAALVDVPATTDGHAPAKPAGFDERNPIAEIIQEACDVINQAGLEVTATAGAGAETTDIPQGEPEPDAPDETVTEPQTEPEQAGGEEVPGLKAEPVADTIPEPAPAPSSAVVPLIDLSNFGL